MFGAMTGAALNTGLTYMFIHAKSVAQTLETLEILRYAFGVNEHF
jgi:hypothetical protein